MMRKQKKTKSRVNKKKTSNLKGANIMRGGFDKFGNDEKECNEEAL